MRQLRDFAIGAAVALLGILVLASVALVIVAKTDWGREQVLRIAIDGLNDAIPGEARIGRLEGNLLRRLHLVDVTIVDEDGVLLVEADRISTNPSLLSLLRRRVVLRETRLEDAHVLLDRPHEKEWNFIRIFVDPEADPDRPPSRWGRWIDLRGVTLVNSHLTVRSAWKPPDDLSREERQETIRKALAPEARTNIVEVPDGFLNVMTFTNLNAQLARVVIAHPRVEGIPIDVDEFAGIVQPFRPPAATVHDLAGNFLLRNDSLFFSDVDAVMPGSRVTGEGVYILDKGDLLLRLEGAPVAINDLRWLHPPLPTEGGGNLKFLLDQRADRTRIVADEIEVSVRDGTLSGHLDMTFGDTLRVRETDLMFAHLDTRLLDDIIPGIRPPRHGLLTGEVALDGVGRAMDLDADVTFDDFAAPASRVLAEGRLAFEPELAFSDLLVRAQPVRAELIRAFVPEFPVAGAVEGFARLTGAPGELLDLESELVIRDPATGVSRILATGGVDLRDDLRLRDLYVRAEPLRLDLVRPQVEHLPVGATATGEVRLDGYPAGLLRLDGHIALTDPRTGLSRVRATGAIDMRAELRLHDLLVRVDPLQLDLLRDEVPELPAGATLIGRARLDGVPARALTLDADLALDDPSSGLSRVVAVGGLRFDPDLLFRDLRLDLNPLQLDLMRAEVPELPPGATLTGPLHLDGSPDGLLHVDGDLALDDPATGVSRIAASGGIDVAEPRFRELDLRLHPLQLAILRRFEPEFPIGGTLDGTATLNGRPDAGLGFAADLTHREAGEVSRVAGRGHVATAHPTGRFDLDLTLEPLSLRTAGRFVPAAGLRGEVAGTLQARGTLQDVGLQASLALPDTGAIVLDGRFDLASDEPGYDLDAQLAYVDLAAITAHAPVRTAFTGSVEAAGRGLDPETMAATVAADLVGPRADEIEADQVLLRASIADGLATFDPAVVRMATADVRVEGSFGLVPERTGVLRYRLEVDSLEAFAAWMAVVDTAGVEPAPVEREAAEGAAARAERAALVEALATGAPPRPVGPPRTLEPTDLPTLAGHVEAEGTLRGNLERFDVDGTAEVEDLAFEGNFVESGRLRYAFAGVGTPAIEADVVAETGAVRIEGFAFDSTSADLTYSGARFGEGELTLAAFHDEHTDFAANLAFILALERNEAILTDTRLRFEDATWTEAQPATIAWGDAGLEVENLELVSDHGARIFLDGRLPVDGDANMDVEIDRLEIAHVLTVLQEDVDLTGLFSAEARVQGTAESPVLEGDAVLTNIIYRDRPMPEMQATFAYADLRLTASAEAVADGRTVAEAEGSVPMDLSLTSEEGPRLLDGPLEVDVHADELPLEIVHLFTDDVRVEEGLAAGTFSMRGTTASPEMQGQISLAAAAVEVIPSGIRYERLRGDVLLQGDDLLIDSLVAQSGGPVRLAGTIDLRNLTAPGFDLTAEAREAWVIDTDDANLMVDAALTIEGPFEAIEIGGDVRIRRGVIYIPELLDADPHDPIDLEDPETFARVDARLRERRDALITPEPLLDNLVIDARVQVDRDVWLRSSEANVEVYTPPEIGPLAIRMDGLTNGPVLEGTVNSDRGEYEFMSRRLNVTRAAVTFDGQEGFNPFVQLVAEHEVLPPGHEPLTIRVLLTGLADDLELNVESDAEPPIAETDLMAFFVFGSDASSFLGHHGSTLAGQGTAGAGILGDLTTVATQQFAGVFMDAIIGGFEAETARALGLDVFRVSTVDVPHEILSGRAEDILRSTEFEAGAYVTPRIFLAGQIRPTFVHPGLLFEYGTPGGFQWLVTLRPRYLTPEPTLEDQEPERTSTFGSFLRRVWRF